MRANPIKTLLSIIVMLFVYTASAQELQSSLFNDLNKIKLEAIKVQANVLSPENFKDGMEAYNEAKNAYLKNGQLSDIKENISESYKSFSDAIETSNINAVMFSEALAARSDAIDAESDNPNNLYWEDAEDEMKDAAEDFEKGNSNNAKEKASKATELYRQAELESIKSKYLANAKSLVKRADDNKVDKVAPKTLKEAKLLISNTEQLLNEDRYDKDEARLMAKQAEYKASLAIHMATQIELLEDKNFEPEDYLLLSYEPVTRIGEHLDMNVKFDKGIEQPLSEITSTINHNKMMRLNLENEIFTKKQEIENYKKIVDEKIQTQKVLKGQLSYETELSIKKQEALQSRINQNAILKAKFDEIQRLFPQQEAQVFRQKNDVIIRMVGVNFDVGKSQIEKENFATISKIEKVADIFEEASIIIEGHTDSQGSDKANLALSQDRADAVLTYLLASTNIDKSRFKTIGYGESKPVSNNETSLGRKQNRRIDVIIKPQIIGHENIGLK
ncbi:OmpA family protein [Mangrovivirga sp. M17]|uniref:OmpA family protein n=1 Tax=Mangrovivirga halotolerans TaxID=2993936 RepID=A0ABT3RR40_9BACT|nr:OmpA family protein [Mangrovivirga halotolerans]MCX2744042.1 OmpA family protein [Mangrovivirga halotolerans]